MTSAADLAEDPAAPPDDGDTLPDAVVVRLGPGRFAVGLGQVAEVGKVPAITRVPGVPGWLAGVANWRGRILPVLDLRQLLGTPGGPLPTTARVVVLTTDVATVGVLVDAVDGTAALGQLTIAAVPEMLPASTDLVCGQVPRDDGPLAVLDVAAVMRLRDSLPRGRRRA